VNSPDEWPAKAAEVSERLHPGTGVSDLADNPMAGLAPELARVVNTMALGGCYARPELDLKTRTLCTVAALVALGEADYAGNWMANALNVGATKTEIVELLEQLFVYIGTPRSVRGFAAAQAAFSRQAATGGVAQNP
jgi:4-carboxymuconolactone decarboxylase